MTSEEVAVGLPTAFSQRPGDMDTLQGELERLNKEIVEANEDRAKAAEYGIVLLEEKQALQTQNEELTSLFDATKRELETAVDVSIYMYTVHVHEHVLLVISGGKLKCFGGSVFFHVLYVSVSVLWDSCGCGCGRQSVLLYTCGMHLHVCICQYGKYICNYTSTFSVEAVYFDMGIPLNTPAIFSQVDQSAYMYMYVQF